MLRSKKNCGPIPGQDPVVEPFRRAPNRLGSDDGRCPGVRPNSHCVEGRPQTLPCSQQGMKVLGTPLGHPEFVSAQLRQVSECHRLLFERIPSVSDLQAAFCCCIVQGPERIICCVPCLRMPRRSTPLTMTGPCVIASAVCWSLTSPTPLGKLRICLSPWVGIAEGFSHQCSRLLGQLG